MESIFTIWIAIFGSPKGFLVDNECEFNNSEFISFCENLNITVAMDLFPREFGRGHLQTS